MKELCFLLMKILLLLQDHNVTVSTTYSQDGSLALKAGLREIGLVARLTEDLLVLEDERCVLQCHIARAADKVFRMPHPPHSACKWASEN